MRCMTVIGTARETAAVDVLTSWDHLELWVGNARAVSHLLQAGFGFDCVAYCGPETGVRDQVGYLLEQGSVRFLVSAGLGEESEIARHVFRHGDGVRTVAFSTRDVDAAFEAAVREGARPVDRPTDHRDDAGWLRTAAIASYGATRHSFVDRRHYSGFAPGYTTEGLPHVRTGDTVGITAIDHVVANVEEGRLDEWVAWYAQVFGFSELRHFDAEQISTEYSALRSTVMWNGGDIKLPINEPAPGRRKSQIQEYLDGYHGPGVQHVALATPDIVRCVDELQRRGVRFLAPPATYYEDARSRCGDLGLPWAELERLGILVDIDGDGHLLQVFTETLMDRPTLFLEMIQREGATGFGEGNFKALFEAIEREQARRGNL